MTDNSGWTRLAGPAISILSTALITISPTLSLCVGVTMQDATVKSLRVRRGRVLMAAPARTWSTATTALVRLRTSVAPAPRRTV